MKLSVTKADAAKYMRQFDNIRIEGAGLLEEVYTHQKFGTFATAAIWREFSQLPPDLREELTVLVPIDEQIMLVNSHADVSTDRVNKMPTSLLKTHPIMFLQMADGSYIMGDGQHRTRLAIINGRSHILGILVPHKVVMMHKVRILLHRKDNGKWEEIDPEMDLASMMGQFPHHALYGGKNG